MNTTDPVLSGREPTEAGTFPPMREPSNVEKGAQPESTVDYRNHNLVAALFPDRARAVEAVTALKQLSRYTPTAIGVLSRSRTFALSAARGDAGEIGLSVVKIGLLGGLVGGLAGLSSPAPSRLESVLLGAGIGVTIGGAAGALIALGVARRQNDCLGANATENSVLVKVRSRDLEESATILRRHRGSLRTSTGAPLPSRHSLP